MRTYLRSADAGDRRQAPRPRAGHRLLGARRRARRSRARVDARDAARRPGRGLRAPRGPAHPHPLRPRRARRARSCAAGPTCRSTCTSAARRTWSTRAARAPPRRASTARRACSACGARSSRCRRRNLHVLTGGETVLERLPRRVHARPRLPPRLLPARADRRRPSSATSPACASRRPTSSLAPTPPPDIDVEAWEASLDLIAGWEPERLALTHFGEVDEDIDGHLERCATRCDEQVERDGPADEEEFVASQTRDARGAHGPRDRDGVRPGAPAAPHLAGPRPLAPSRAGPT